MTPHLAAAAALATVLAAPAAAQVPPAHPDIVQEAVRYTAAETTSPDGARRIAFRIKVAADRACGGRNLLIRTGLDFRRCRRDAIDRAITTLGSPLVAQAMGRSPALAQR